jgi:uncharacterized protein (AIM24 family)
LLASPNARRLAREIGIDLSSVRGSGPGGRIVSEDVEEFEAPVPTGTGTPPAPTRAAALAAAGPLVRRHAVSKGVDLDQVLGTGPAGRIRREDVDAVAATAAAGKPTTKTEVSVDAEETVIPLTGMRAAIAQRMHTSLHEMAQLTHGYEVRLDGVVWAKAGAMVARKGGVKFTRQGVMEQGLGNLLKKMVSGEGMQLMKVEGEGRVYLADAGKKITLLRLAGEAIFVNGNDVLAIEAGIENKITMMRKVAGMLSGGLFNVRLSGHGIVAITSHYEPLTLPVNAQTGPVFTDPNATVAWSGGLTPEIITDISLGTLLGRGSGESVQLRFAGEGWVVVQPYEEVVFQAKE